MFSYKKFKSVEQADNYELGIVRQRAGEYELAVQTFKNLITDDPAFAEAHNSLGLTFKKMKDFDNALKSYNQGIEAHFQNIYDEIKNNPLREIDKRYAKSQSKTWIGVAMQIAAKNGAKDGMTNALLPTGETAMKFMEQNPLLGFAFHDEKDTRYILPAYFSAFYEALKSDLIYSTFANNVGTVFAEIDDKEQARSCFIESIEFIPTGIIYDYPNIGLHELES